MEKATQGVSLSLASSLQGHSGLVWCTAWDPKGKILASCGQDKVIRLWSEREGGRWVLTDELSRGHTKSIRSISFSPDGRCLAAAGFDGVISIWINNDSGWRCVANLEGHENEVKSVNWSPDGRFLSSCGRDKTVWIWLVNSDSEELDFECLAVLPEHTQDVKMVCFHPIDSGTLLSTSYDDTIRIWKSDISMDDEWICRDKLTEHSSTVWAASFTKFGNYFVTVGDDKKIGIYKKDDKSYKNIYQKEFAHQRPILSISVDHNVAGEDELEARNFRFATAGGRHLKIWNWSEDVNEVTELGNYCLGDLSEINCVCWNPKDPNLLSIAGDNGNTQILRLTLNT